MKHIDDLKALTELMNLMADGRPLIYFAHPMSTYGTELELKIIANLEEAGYAVVNPSADWMQEAFQRFREANPGNYIEFFARVARYCRACAALPFPEGLNIDGLTEDEKKLPLVGFGISYEVESMLKLRRPIFLLKEGTGTHNWQLMPFKSLSECTQLDRNQTRQALNLYKPD